MLTQDKAIADGAAVAGWRNCSNVPDLNLLRAETRREAQTRFHVEGAAAIEEDRIRCEERLAAIRSEAADLARTPSKLTLRRVLTAAAAAVAGWQILDHLFRMRTLPALALAAGLAVVGVLLPPEPFRRLRNAADGWRLWWRLARIDGKLIRERRAERAAAAWAGAEFERRSALYTLWWTRGRTARLLGGQNEIDHTTGGADDISFPNHSTDNLVS